ncbi:MAG: N-acetylmuramoyl-L-alanine amidase [Rickettsiales bacterium]|nr:N-acetylmuramoyl-L-alanine amidase [Rickettsiales bacterium]
MIIKKCTTFLAVAIGVYAFSLGARADVKQTQPKPQAPVNKVADAKILKLIDEFDDYPIYESELKTDMVHGYIGTEKTGETVKLDILFERREMSDLITISGHGIENKEFVLTSMQGEPPRFFIDVFGAKIKNKNVVFEYKIPKGTRLKYGRQPNANYRIAFDLETGAHVKNVVRAKDTILALLAYDNRHREIKKIEPKQAENATTSHPHCEYDNGDVTMIDNFAGLKKVSSNAKFQKVRLDNGKQPVIAIDAGHGGVDSGAIGVSKTKEKTITLIYAKELQFLLKRRGFKVVMTRNRNKTIQLGNRVQIGQKGGADIFISLHTDSHQNKKMSGTTIYRLSHLNEKHSDWKRFYNKNYLPTHYEKYLSNTSVLDVLLGMTHKSLLEKSSAFVNNILLDFKKKGICRNCRHGQRSLAVLRGLNMISILIEIGYITNPDEEEKILSADYIRKFCTALADAIENTFR